MGAMTSSRDLLLDHITDLAIVHGRVTLSSGAEADYYVDLRRVTLHGEAAPLVALAREAVEGVTGRPAHVGAIHAGLECGLIKVEGGRGCVRERKEERSGGKAKKNLTSLPRKIKNLKTKKIRQSSAPRCGTPSPSGPPSWERTRPTRGLT